MGTTELAPSAAELLDLYERMVLIRRTEERLSVESMAGSLPGAVHLYIGEEAVAVGVSAHLGDVTMRPPPTAATVTSSRRAAT